MSNFIMWSKGAIGLVNTNSSTPSEPSPLHPRLSRWHDLIPFLAKFFRTPKPSELEALRAQIRALRQENAHLKCQLESQDSPTDLVRLAYTDLLTGLPNRRALHCAAAREIARARRSGRPLCVLLADIDHFKAINDDFGHAAGDATLRLSAETLAAHTRTTDTVARWGGEEFVLLLPETNLAAAGIVAEKCRQAVQALTTNLPRSITITLGVSEINPMECFDRALDRADCAMYAGKKRGRNCVVVG